MMDKHYDAKAAEAKWYPLWEKNGYFHDERWPYLRELYEVFQHDYMNTLADMNRYGEYFATNEEYVRKYRFANAFHPFHGLKVIFTGVPLNIFS